MADLRFTAPAVAFALPAFSPCPLAITAFAFLGIVFWPSAFVLCLRDPFTTENKKSHRQRFWRHLRLSRFLGESDSNSGKFVDKSVHFVIPVLKVARQRLFEYLKLEKQEMALGVVHFSLKNQPTFFAARRALVQCPRDSVSPMVNRDLAPVFQHFSASLAGE